LESLCLPASVEAIGLEAFPGGAGLQVEIEPGNPNFHMEGDFLIATQENCIVTCFGSRSAVTIPAHVKAIGQAAFYAHEFVERVDFEDSGDGCKLEVIRDGAFMFCDDLESMDLPSSVVALGESCFQGCGSLRTFTFAGDSKLERIYDWAFKDCWSLESFIVPSSVRFIGKGCFRACDSIRNFELGFPSHVKELLDLPREWPGLKDIPDSVEVLGFAQGYENRCEYTLSFGNESKLRKIYTLKSRHAGRAFLRVSSRSLKIFRSDLEFSAPIQLTA
jgi:hypothetical protein